MSKEQKLEEVTLKAPKKGSFSFRGETVKDGQTAQVTPSQKKWLGERDLIGGPAPKSSASS